MEKIFTAEKRFLNFPVRTGAEKILACVKVAGMPPYEFLVELAGEDPESWMPMDISHLKGKKIELSLEKIPDGSTATNKIFQSDEIVGAAELYREALRPQFHFTASRGWINDPNGLVFYNGEWHLFYQLNPYGVRWDNMHWGHALSKDLVHWKELPIALYPDESGTMFSGSAVVDWKNTAGFKTGDEPPIVLIYTTAGSSSRLSEGKPYTQCLAYSNDRGRSWTKFAGNPVLPQIAGGNRDPKVVWHEPTQRWIMSLYLDGNKYALLSSSDLKNWKHLCELTIPGTSECPDFFEMPLDKDERKTRWILLGANGGYLVGRFDGKSFVQEGGVSNFNFGNCCYAGQSFSDVLATDGRRIMIMWARWRNFEDKESHHGMPFSSMMAFPVEMELRNTENGPRLFLSPAREIELLHSDIRSYAGLRLSEKETVLVDPASEFLDVSADINIMDAEEVRVNVRGVELIYDARHKKLKCEKMEAPLTPGRDGKIQVRVLADRMIVEFFAGDGQVYMPVSRLLDEKNKTVSLSSSGNAAVDVIVRKIKTALNFADI